MNGMNLDATLDLLARNPTAPVDLAELALHLARDEFPDLDVEAYLSELQGMAHEAQRYLRGSLEARVSGLGRYLFHEMGFHGNTQDYYDPRNSYFNQVLDSRIGIPITLALVAQTVGNRAGLNIVGVGLPGHFVAKAVADGDEVLFDPFHGGRFLTPEQCGQMVERVTGRPFRVTTEALQPTPNGYLVVRMLTNLKGIYISQGDLGRAARVLHRLLQLNPADPLLRRDLGICLIRAERPGMAIDHLAAYLQAAPTANDTATVRKLLDRAQAEVARWN